jgi:hypothetical protein
MKQQELDFGPSVRRKPHDHCEAGISDFEFNFLPLLDLPPRRYRDARVLLARQAALAAAGPRHRAYFRKYRARLIQDADELIATSPHFVRYYTLIDTGTD